MLRGAGSRMLTAVVSRGAVKALSSAGTAGKYHLHTTSAMAYLIEDPKYAFLKELGLGKTNLGGFNGKWMGSGKVRFVRFSQA